MTTNCYRNTLPLWGARRCPGRCPVSPAPTLLDVHETTSGAAATRQLVADYTTHVAGLVINPDAKRPPARRRAPDRRAP